jgi:hypothetical protein
MQLRHATVSVYLALQSCYVVWGCCRQSSALCVVLQHSSCVASFRYGSCMPCHKQHVYLQSESCLDCHLHLVLFGLMTGAAAAAAVAAHTAHCWHHVNRTHETRLCSCVAGSCRWCIAGRKLHTPYMITDNCKSWLPRFVKVMSRNHPSSLRLQWRFRSVSESPAGEAFQNDSETSPGHYMPRMARCQMHRMLGSTHTVPRDAASGSMPYALMHDTGQPRWPAALLQCAAHGACTCAVHVLHAQSLWPTTRCSAWRCTCHNMHVHMYSSAQQRLTQHHSSELHAGSASAVIRHHLHAKLEYMLFPDCACMESGAELLL